MAKTPLYQHLASLVIAVHNCERPGFNGNPDYPGLHIDAINALARDHLPHGSGFDRGCMVRIDDSSSQCLIIETAFHHMDDNGFYCGWSDHVVRVRAHLAFGFVVSVSGVNRRGIKDYISDVFHSALSELVEGVNHGAP